MKSLPAARRRVSTTTKRNLTGILGTDISNQVVARASYGEYNRMEMERGLPAEMLARHFMLSVDRWRIRDEIRSIATFRTMNLLEPFWFPYSFDLIFCRNVAIYFTEALAKDGALMIGSTESISGLCPELEPKRYLRAVFYQWKNTASASIP
jgi:chemotaxis protein methyltransferase CheR